MIVIDATNLIMGRLATVAAKKALLGEEVKVINCENAVISGTKGEVLQKYVTKRERGTPRVGPFISRSPDRILRRAIRGMIPYKKGRGKEVYSRVMCYLGVPDELKDKKAITIDDANISKLPTLKYLDLKTLSRRLGAKIE